MIKRFFIPGSEWLFIKIYTGEMACERILTHALLPYTEACLKKGWIKEWFFLRYHDSGFHLRVRLHVTDKGYIGDIINALYRKCNPYMESEMIHRICIDTYTREIERYGARCMEISENIFCIDSRFTTKMLSKLSGNAPLGRSLFAFVLIDTFLSALKFDTEKKISIMTKMDESFKREFGFNRHNLKGLNAKYREFRKQIDDAIDNTSQNEHLTAVYPLLQRRQKALENLKLADYKKLDIISHIHMMMNRLFINKNRMNEVVVYNFIVRYYKSRIARSGSPSK